MKKVGIIGAGASGIFCAIALKRYANDIEVILFEKQARIGKKILATGNGKCNLSNIHMDESFYNTPLVKDCLLNFLPQDCINYFKDLGLMTKIDNEGRIYPYSERATTVLDIFLKELNKQNVNILLNQLVKKIKKNNDIFEIITNQGTIEVDYLVMATGSKASITYEADGYNLLQQLGHNVTNLTPALVALKVKESTKSLNGIKVKATAHIVGEKYFSRGEVLFKEDGLSGIAIFCLSRFFKENTIISLDLAEDKTIEELQTFLTNKDNIFGMFPKMICEDLLQRSKGQMTALIKMIKDYRFTVLKTYPFNVAQITKGGVFLNEVDLTSFTSKKVQNLYIIGEVLDVDGTCGGYNLHFAWASAISAARNIVRR